MKQPQQNSQKSSAILPLLSSELHDFQKLAQGNGLALDDARVEQMLAYARLLLEWNRSFNLISREDEGRIVSRHVAESVGLLIIAAPAASSMIMDFGSGGGFPAVPIKILRPDLKLTLVESNGKKASFLKNVGTKLSLRDYLVLNRRVESLTSTDIPKQDIVMARAVADLPALWKWASIHLRAGGKLAAIKGDDQKEIDSVSAMPGISEISTTPFPAWLKIEKSRLAVSITKE